MRAYEDQVFEKPSNFYDNWEGRLAAQQQEMSVASQHDMDLIYDNKAYLPGDTSRLSENYLNYVNRLDKEDLQKYWAFHDSLSCDFFRRFPQMRGYSAQSPKDDAVTDWKFQR